MQPTGKLLFRVVSITEFQSPCGEFGNAAIPITRQIFGQVEKFQSPCGEFGNAAI